MHDTIEVWHGNHDEDDGVTFFGCWTYTTALRDMHVQALGDRKGTGRKKRLGTTLAPRKAIQHRHQTAEILPWSRWKHSPRL